MNKLDKILLKRETVPTGYISQQFYSFREELKWFLLFFVIGQVVSYFNADVKIPSCENFWRYRILMSGLGLSLYLVVRKISYITQLLNFCYYIFLYAIILTPFVIMLQYHHIFLLGFMQLWIALSIFFHIDIFLYIVLAIFYSVIVSIFISASSNAIYDANYIKILVESLTIIFYICFAINYFINRFRLSNFLQRQELQTTADELRVTLSTLERAKESLVQSSKLAALGKLLSGVAHEMKNPAFIIANNYTFIDRYIREHPDGSYNEFLQENKDNLSRIGRGVHRIKTVLQELQKFGRQDRQVFEPIHFHAVIDSVVGLLSHECEKKITLHTQYASDDSIDGNAEQLGQVMMNLITNALHAIKDQGDIWITTQRENDMLIVKVKDNGCGISPEDLPKIFDPFFTTKGTEEGIGLGLSISYDIIKDHRGTIEAHSTQGETEFIITLPVIQPKSDTEVT